VFIGVITSSIKAMQWNVSCGSSIGNGDAGHQEMGEASILIIGNVRVVPRVACRNREPDKGGNIARKAKNTFDL